MKPFFALLFLVLFAPAFSSLDAQQKIVTVPDFTRGDTLPKDAPHDWNLGATGARGWIFSSHGHSKKARQILVTAVAQGSPAASKLKKGDVLLGVNGKPFASDARVQLAKAITVAESRQGKGKLRLLRWRDQKTQRSCSIFPCWGLTARRLRMTVLSHSKFLSSDANRWPHEWRSRITLVISIRSHAR